MIRRIYRLMDPKRIEMIQREVSFGRQDVIVRPDYLSICAADQRYFFGQRDREALNAKLPMALIHEATATVLYDGSGELSAGTKVVLVPLIEINSDSQIKANYVSENQFASSGIDGFMQDLLAIPCDRVIPIRGDYSPIYVFCELISVVFNALETFEKCRLTKADSFGIWGSGNMGFIAGLVIRCLYPNAKVYIFGRNMRKLQYFPFVDGAYAIDRIPKNLQISHCFECVGGEKSADAIKQIVEMISPQGCVNLLGVSETPVSIPTRDVLSKGLVLLGHSRSNAEDMRKAVNFIEENNICRKYLSMLISESIPVRHETDMIHAFERSAINNFKTVMKWEA